MRLPQRSLHSSALPTNSSTDQAGYKNANAVSWPQQMANAHVKMASERASDDKADASLRALADVILSSTWRMIFHHTQTRRPCGFLGSHGQDGFM